MDIESFEQLGGRAIIARIASSFYDKVYAHPWLGKFFAEVPQDVIESQQVDFMQQSLGGPRTYLGKYPIPAHRHMFIPDKLYIIRQQLLVASLNECDASEELIDRWLRIDNAFRKGIVKESLDDCEKRYATDEIVVFEDPRPWESAE